MWMRWFPEMNSVEEDPPLVSVCMITYQHAFFIRQALDSVLMQEHSFPMELCIGEDGSTDGTRDICQEYASRYEGLVRLFVRDRGDAKRTTYAAPFMYNFVETFKSCRGKYVALCEGDDYWSDPQKLQKQVNFLEAHPDYSMVFTAAKTLRGLTQQDWDPPPIVKNSYSLDDILERNFVCTPTVMFRNGVSDVLLEWLRKMQVGDWPLHISNAMRGEFGYINEPMAVYRVHDQGAWSRLGGVKRLEGAIAASRMLMKLLPVEYKAALQRGIELSQKQIVSFCLVWGNQPSVGRWHVFAILAKGRWPFERFSHALRATVWFFCPPLGRLLRKRSESS